MKKTIIWAVIIFAAIWIWKENSFISNIMMKSSGSQNQIENMSFSLTTSDDWSEDVFIPIEYNDPVEFDGMSRDQIMAFRMEKIEAHEELINGNYNYSKKVFGQIQDRYPWWGIEGQLCYGPGNRSIEGKSEESRFILNPFLLLMLNNSSAYVSKDPNCTPVLPGPPLNSILYPKQNRLDITYNIDQFLSERSNQHGFPESKEISIVGMNARDFGYNYVYFDPQYTAGVSGIVTNSAFSDIQLLKDFIHKGGSCGYPNGCNNGSPNQPQIYFTVDYLPAYIYAKLWKNNPEDKDSQSDFDVRLILE